MQTLQIIDKIRFFDGLAPDEKEHVSRMQLRIFKYDAGTTIIKERAEDNSLYILIKGTATVVGKKSEPVAILKAGEVFGEISFLAPMPRTASVVANNEVIVMRVDREAFQLLDAPLREKFKDKLIEVVIHRLLEGGEQHNLEISSFGWTHKP